MMNKVDVPYPNPADDCSFEELGKNISRAIMLEVEIKKKQLELDNLVKDCEREKVRLKEIGYDMLKLPICIKHEKGFIVLNGKQRKDGDVNE